MPKYRKKPIVVEAIQWNGHNWEELYEFFGAPESLRYEGPPNDNVLNNLIINTLKGPMRATPGDYIVRGIHGEYYPVKQEIFEETYEPVGD